ncbi:MAG: adenine phosphoribosyltransferase [Candidatus Omnitrophota bacterium]|nr:MAG: adenine phosphoribosyltransferase [Candidatus Omnitrophota bacterium]
MSEKIIDELKASIRSIPDFPKKGILFRDITTLLKDAQKFKDTVDLIADKYKNKKIDKVVAVEARGFIFGGALAYKLGAAFIPIRKKGKLPAEVLEATYELEYGTDTLQVHRDAIGAQDKILIVDDLLATGGTVKATCELIEKSGAEIVGIEFLIELVELNGREKLTGYPVDAVIKF